MLGRVERWYMGRSLWLSKRIVMFLAITMLVFAVLVATRDTSLGVQDQPDASPGALEMTAADVEIAALEAQLDQMRRSDERLIQTVYWSLSVLVGVSVFLVGFSWFSNMRLTENDRRQLRDEMDSAISTRVSEIQENMNHRLDDLQSRALETVAARVTASEQEHQKRFKEIQSQLSVTQYALLESMARTELGRGNMNEVLNTAATIIVVGQQADIDGAVARGLDLAQSALSQGASPSAALVAEINQALDDLPPRFETDRDVVRNLLTEVRTRMNAETLWES